MIRVAMDSVADILENQLSDDGGLGLKGDPLPLAVQYVRDVAYVLELLKQ